MKDQIKCIYGLLDCRERGLNLCSKSDWGGFWDTLAFTRLEEHRGAEREQRTKRWLVREQIGFAKNGDQSPYHDTIYENIDGLR